MCIGAHISVQPQWVVLLKLSCLHTPSMSSVTKLKLFANVLTMLCTASMSTVTQILLCTASVSIVTHTLLCTASVSIVTHTLLCTASVSIATHTLLCTASMSIVTHTLLCTASVSIVTHTLLYTASMSIVTHSLLRIASMSSVTHILLRTASMSIAQCLFSGRCLGALEARWLCPGTLFFGVTLLLAMVWRRRGLSSTLSISPLGHRHVKSWSVQQLFVSSADLNSTFSCVSTLPATAFVFNGRF